MKNLRFTFLCDFDELQMLAALALQLQRSRGDVIRLLIRREARSLNIASKAEKKEVLCGETSV
jgi:hypothetical protein